MDGQLSLFDYMDSDKNMHITPVEKKILEPKRSYPCDDCHFWSENSCEYGIDSRKEFCKKHKSLRLERYEPGDWVEEIELGEEITFDDIVNMVGELIILDKSTSSHRWFKVVKIEKIIPYEDGYRRLVYYDNHPQRGYVNEIYFKSECNGLPDRAWKIKESNKKSNNYIRR